MPPPPPNLASARAAMETRSVCTSSSPIAARMHEAGIACSGELLDDEIGEARSRDLRTAIRRVCASEAGCIDLPRREAHARPNDERICGLIAVLRDDQRCAIRERRRRARSARPMLDDDQRTGLLPPGIHRSRASRKRATARLPPQLPSARRIERAVSARICAGGLRVTCGAWWVVSSAPEAPGPGQSIFHVARTLCAA